MDNSQYVKDYSDNSFFEKIKKTFSKAGVQVVYGHFYYFMHLKTLQFQRKPRLLL